MVQLFSKMPPVVSDIGAVYRLARAVSVRTATKALPGAKAAWQARCNGTDFPLSLNGAQLRWGDVKRARTEILETLCGIFTEEALELARLPWNETTIQDMGSRGVFKEDAVEELASKAKGQRVNAARSKRRAAFGLFAAGPTVIGVGLGWNWYQASQAPWNTDFDLATRMMDSADTVFQGAAVLSFALALIGAFLYFPSRKVLKKTKD